MLLFVPQWAFLHLGENPLTRVYILMYARYCSACRLHLFVARLESSLAVSIRYLWSFGLRIYCGVIVTQQ